MSRDIINELGSLALATRLKNLSDRLAKDVAQYYKSSDVDFEPRWFTLIYALKEGEELSITQLATMLQQTHPAVNQVANVLVEKGLVSERKDDQDQRKRLIKLTDKGLRLVSELEPLWSSIKAANDQLLKDSEHLIESLASVEQALDDKSMKDRLKD